MNCRDGTQLEIDSSLRSNPESDAKDQDREKVFAAGSSKQKGKLGRYNGVHTQVVVNRGNVYNLASVDAAIITSRRRVLVQSAGQKDCSV